MYLACDLGGSTGRVGVFDQLGQEKVRSGMTFEMTSTRPGVIGDFERDYDGLRRTCQAFMATMGPMKGVGLAVAGRHDECRQTLTMAGNLGHWSGKPIVEMLSHDLGGCRVVLGNDAEALAVAELLHGVGQQDEYRGQNFLGMIWGTGVGGAAVEYDENGNPFVTPMEPGHIRLLDTKPLRCGCGQTGCVEAYCGGNGIRARFGKGAERLTDKEWLERVVPYMVCGLRALLSVHPVDLMVFGGGMACKDAWLLKAIEAQLGGPRLVLSRFGETAGTVGALELLNPRVSLN